MKKTDQNCYLTLDPTSNRTISSESEMNLTENNFMTAAQEKTRDFSNFQCPSCRQNCYFEKDVFVSIGSNDILRQGKHSVVQIKSIKKLLLAANVKSLHFLPVPYMCPPHNPAFKQTPSQVKNRIINLNSELAAINSSLSAQKNITYNSQLRKDNIHLSHQCVSHIFLSITKRLKNKDKRQKRQKKT